jgi:CO/xanthine dehydrogenase FAD-binding subunit
MIREYHRPKTLDEALTLISQPDTLPLGGGTLLSMPQSAPVKVVDLQSLGLNTVKKQGNSLEIGATATLQQLLEDKNCPQALKTALKLEAPLNLRNMATVAGTLVTCDGRSTFATMMLALDAKVSVSGKQKAEETINIGDLLPLRNQLSRKLITKITFPLNVKLAFEYVSRTPADKPIVCAALAQWNSGRTRLALGGYGKSPLLAMDGTEADGLEAAARNAFHEATDEWASAEYRSDIAAVLAKRCMENTH